jgi:hypothetical protein
VCRVTAVLDKQVVESEPSRWSYTPNRLLLRMVVGMLVAAAVLVVGSLLMSRVRDQVDTIGDSAAPQAATASDLYFSLSDIDAQVARLVLVGNAETQAGNRIDALTTYGQRSRQIDADLERMLTASVTDQDRATINGLLNDLGVYRQWTWQALTIVWQTPADPSGALPDAALGYYSQATNMVHHELLPAAERLRDASQANLDQAYSAQRSSAVWGIVLVVVLGGALVVLLVAVQYWLARQFRRRVNPALLAGTLLTLGLVISASTVFVLEGSRLSDAQRDSFAPYLALSKAQAISYDAAADTSRYLLSERLPSYRTDFMHKSDCLLKGGSCGPDGEQTSGGLEALASGPDVAPDFARAVADRWENYQRTHDRVVDLANAGRTTEAIDALTGISRGDAAFDFYYYDTAISQITADRKQAFDAAFLNVQGLLTGWSIVPIVVMGIVLFLVPIGMWPRVSEYR